MSIDPGSESISSMLSSTISATFVNIPDVTVSFTLHSTSTVTLDNLLFTLSNGSNS